MTESTKEYYARENLKRRQLIYMIGSGIRCNVQVAGDFQLGMIPPDELDTHRAVEKLTDDPRGTIITIDQHRKLAERLDTLTAQHEALCVAHEERIGYTKKLRGDWGIERTQLLASIKRLREERDELLDAATKPTTKKEKALKGEGMATPQGAKYTKKGTRRKNKLLLTDEEVWAVRRFLKMGRLNIWISKHMGIPTATVWKIKSGRTYKHVPAEPKRKPVTVKAGKGEVSNDK